MNENIANIWKFSLKGKHVTFGPPWEYSNPKVVHIGAPEVTYWNTKTKYKVNAKVYVNYIPGS